MTGFYKKYGPWALVTGASSGIGEEFARQLARWGFNLVLAARRKELMDQLGEELSDSQGVETRTVEVDLSEPNSLDILKEGTQGIEIGLLINNAGTDAFGSFIKNSLEDATKLVYLNSVAPMRLTHYFSQSMLQRGKGGIILVGSLIGYAAAPFWSNYAASKAYLLTFGESLYYEFKQKGLDVTVLAPGYTSTPMLHGILDQGVDLNKGPKHMDVSTVVKIGLDALGKKPSVIPGNMNKAMAFMNKHVMTRKSQISMYGKLIENVLPEDRI